MSTNTEIHRYTKIQIWYKFASICFYLYKRRNVLNVYPGYQGPKSIHVLIDVAPDAITAENDAAEGYNYMTICISFQRLNTYQLL